ncbi:MAG: glycosyltransferase [Gammaproteobacteria bacterium]|nr:glycosyltransferase [Gammaproteobacteria bacterium]MCI0590729.1 glycosyltransferase [Gammaproteobacteria bacterium]
MSHIVIVTTSFPGGQPGSEAAGSFVSDLAEELARYARVTVLAPGLREDVEGGPDYSIRRFRAPYLPLSLLHPMNLTHWPKILQVLRLGKAALFDVVERHAIDHIFALWALPSGYWARQVFQTRGIPYSVWVLGSDMWSLSTIPVVRTLLRTVLRESRHRFADGRGLARDVEALAGCACEFLPSARRLARVDRKVLSACPPYKLAFLGRMHPNKGIDLLFEALGRLEDEDWTKISGIKVGGGGPLEGKVRGDGLTLQRSGRPITFCGYLDKSKAQELITWADWLLLPSRIESIPLVFSDAMMCQCPVISTPVGDLPSLIDDYQVGIYSSLVTPESYVGAIRRALRRSPIEYNDGMRAAARQFDLSLIAARLVAQLLKVPG